MAMAKADFHCCPLDRCSEACDHARTPIELFGSWDLGGERRSGENVYNTHYFVTADTGHLPLLSNYYMMTSESPALWWWRHFFDPTSDGEVWRGASGIFVFYVLLRRDSGKEQLRVTHGCPRQRSAACWRHTFDRGLNTMYVFYAHICNSYYAYTRTYWMLI